MMLFYTLYLFLLLHILPTTTAAAGPAYTATDFILLNCGASSALNDTSGRSWDSDERTRYAPPNSAAISSTSTASHMDPSVFLVPYETARVFHSPFSYSFPVLTGPKFLRLYFYPTTYSAFNASQSFFSVTANGFTLLSNFSAFLYSQNSSELSFKKEFIINVQENQRLNLTFSPNTNSFAFINGIEIVSLPDQLYFKGNDVPINSVTPLFYLKNDTALENLYRLNVGGNDVAIQYDSGPIRGMFRAWSQDNDYIFGGDWGYTTQSEDLPIDYNSQTPPYSAPEIVYKTSRVMGNTSGSLEWSFLVDSGFSYLLRFHFCEIQLEVTEPNERVFDISVDNQMVDVQVDIISMAGGTRIPIYKDYVVWVSDDGHHGKTDLLLSMFPNTEGHPKYGNSLLNGLEIFKLSANRSLAAVNPEPTDISSPPPLKVPENKKNKMSSVIYPVIGSLIGFLATFIALSSFLIFRRRQKIKDSLSTSGAKVSLVPLPIASRSTTNGSSLPLPSDLCKQFSLDELKMATGNFNDNFVIGKGGFGNVYKGFIDHGASTVAIKRLKSSSSQGAREFLNEIEMLSKLRHLHLVSLVGYCGENGEMILVYDYMAHGTLRDHLYNSDNSSLKWKQRLQICIGAAKGLHYLHTGAEHSIIHRDVKSTNILLDEKWVAKVSDFGLSKVGPTGGAHTHVSTVVKGSIGYVDPEYYKRQQLTHKSDIYSFGVVLFEVLCARPAVIPSLPREQVSLAEWGKFCYAKRTIEQIIDTNLEGQIAPECLSKFVETAVMCLGEKGIERPTMSDVVWSLEFAMQLQEAAEDRGGSAVDGGENFVLMDPSYPLPERGEPNTTDEEIFSGHSDGVSRSKSSGLSTVSTEKLKSGEVFSELMNPTRR
ncbi:Serine/threonine protein kinase [Handroanthus impetiginosus]|uniref:Serine/threonine protein kinase n=1 Tax=Handroanthus impetiginosus TaxID=429701 RepID=A0A2G9IBQ3_9LAMI|nr:Serine/threonine protein kinase [Handroanthus impetiginosus]